MSNPNSRGYRLDSRREADTRLLDESAHISIREDEITGFSLTFPSAQLRLNLRWHFPPDGDFNGLCALCSFGFLHDEQCDLLKPLVVFFGEVLSALRSTCSRVLFSTLHVLLMDFSWSPGLLNFAHLNFFEQSVNWFSHLNTMNTGKNCCALIFCVKLWRSPVARRSRGSGELSLKCVAVCLASLTLAHFVASNGHLEATVDGKEFRFVLYSASLMCGF